MRLNLDLPGQLTQCLELGMGEIAVISEKALGGRCKLRCDFDRLCLTASRKVASWKLLCAVR